MVVYEYIYGQSTSQTNTTIFILSNVLCVSSGCFAFFVVCFSMTTLFTLQATADLGVGSRTTWTPTQSTDIVNKAYVDAAAAGGGGGTISGLGIIAPVTVASTTALIPYTYSSVSGTDTLTSQNPASFSLDGVSSFNGGSTRVLIKDETSSNAVYNGVYIVTAQGSRSSNWILSRASDFSNTTQMIAGAEVTVTSGNTLKDTSWMLQNAIVSVNVTPVVFVPFAVVQTTVTNSKVSASDITGINLFSLNYAQYNSTSTTIDLTKTFHIFQDNTTPISVTLPAPTNTSTLSLLGFSNCGTQVAKVMFSGFGGPAFLASNGDTSAVGLQFSKGQSLFLIYNPVCQQYQSMMGGADVLV